MGRKKFKPALLLLLTLLAVSFALAGCPARKPAEPERVVIPEVSKVFFEQVDKAAAPPVVKDLVERFAGKDARLALLADGNVWVVAASEDQDEKLQVKEVIRRVINEHTTVLEIKLAEQEASQGQSQGKNGKQEPLIAKLNTNALSSGAVFYTEEEEKAEEKENGAQGTAPPKNKQAAAVPQAQPKEVQQFIEVEQPEPGAKVESPLEVTGKARVSAGAVKVRLRDGEGNILAETETVAGQGNSGGGAFKAVLIYEKPQQPTKGRLEVLSVSRTNGAEANMKVIPLTIQ
ncbi:Gmad2 immunoglobulin-like domain-containing protein [Zhaonella formicivorans]|uniref:Gmad2 immunoglobulin-like domain-containing protein n=1 Tax=Zhaonella formicivorans TaxID=2528593 RepID=UPI001D11DDF6|nr:Gmad2 immunoglobulin-like domain-containing protein [Zhaonella formicivorans]